MARAEVRENPPEEEIGVTVMTDWLTRQQRSRNMASIRSRGNRTTEARFAALLRAARISGWRRQAKLPGKPDFAFPKNRLAVFVDGCFWHGCPRCYRLPQDNRHYWREKVRSNRRRDRQNARALRLKGWKVLRVWEHQLKSEVGRQRIVSKIRQSIAL
jgi:DNA mismatch endonuclease (patch repair protein)